MKIIFEPDSFCQKQEFLGNKDGSLTYSRYRVAGVAADKVNRLVLWYVHTLLVDVPKADQIHP